MMNNTVTQLKTKTQRWAEKITDTYSDSVQAIVEVGHQLQQAKADCSHGEWGELTGETTGIPMLPFSHQTARRLKSIAANPALTNRAHGRDLPASWRILAVLASVGADDIEAAIADGDIHPDMKRKDAEALKAKVCGKAEPEKRESAPVVHLDAMDFSRVGPPMTDEERAYIEQAPERIGRALADFANRTAEQDRAAEEIAELFPARHDTSKSELLGLEVLARLRELVGLIKQSETSPILIDEHRQQAIGFLEEIRSHLTGSA